MLFYANSPASQSSTELRQKIRALAAEIKSEVNGDDWKRKEARPDTLERKMEERLAALVKQSVGVCVCSHRSLSALLIAVPCTVIS
jgi:hypothetical protein